MFGMRLIVAALMLVPAVAAAEEQQRPLTDSMRTGLAGLAAWEAAAYPSSPRPAQRTVRPAPRVRSAAELTGLAGLAAREAASWIVPSRSSRAVANSGLKARTPTKLRAPVRWRSIRRVTGATRHARFGAPKRLASPRRSAR